MMAHWDKTPPIKLNLDNEFFNLMLEILTRNEEINVDSTDENAKKLKNKLLRYTRTEKLGDGKKLARVAFFDREAAEMISQLLVFEAVNNDMEISTDYYSVVEKVREANNSAKEE